MKNTIITVLVLCLVQSGVGQSKTCSVHIEEFTWMEAEKILKQYDVVMIALGARTKEHGPHLLLKNDYVMAEELKNRVIGQVPREELSQQGIEMRFLNILEVDENLPEGLLQQEGGTHADEGETSMMLYLAPDTVNMKKAVKDYDARPNRRGLTRDSEGPGHYSPTGIWGDPTLATQEKGRIIVEATVQAVVKQIKELIAYKMD